MGRSGAFSPSQKPNSLTGFSLLELVIVLTILAILAVVLIPLFAGIRNQAKDDAVVGALASMREAIQIYRMDEIVSGRKTGVPGDNDTNGCPDNEMRHADQWAGPWVMEGGQNPPNPWADAAATSAGREAWVGITYINPKGTLLFLGMVGWNYNPHSCEIWANSTNNGGPITENEF